MRFLRVGLAFLAVRATCLFEAGQNRAQTAGIVRIIERRFGRARKPHGPTGERPIAEIGVSPAEASAVLVRGVGFCNRTSACPFALGWRAGQQHPGHLDQIAMQDAPHQTARASRASSPGP